MWLANDMTYKMTKHSRSVHLMYGCNTVLLAEGVHTVTYKFSFSGLKTFKVRKFLVQGFATTKPLIRHDNTSYVTFQNFRFLH